MFGLSIFEILFLAGLALIVIGPKELPQVARTLGRLLNELKRSTSGFADELKQQARIDRIDLYEAPKKSEPPQQASAPSPAPSSAQSEVVPEQMELIEQKVDSSTSSEVSKS